MSNIETRVTRRFLGAISTEKMTALLLKLRKGADASVSLKQFIEVLNYLGGWRVEPFVGLLQLHGYSGAEKDKPSLKAGEDAAQVQADWDRMQHSVVSTLPTSPQVGKQYVMDLTAPTTEGFRPGVTGFYYREWVGAKGIRFTSPEGKIFELLPGKYEFARYPDPIKLPFHDIRAWVRNETKFLEQVSNALGMATHEKEREESKPRTRDNTGTCPACFRNIKLKARGGNQHPIMVLHGYLRPGWGSVQGSCFGVDFPPFELSPEGTKHLVKVLEQHKDGKEDFLKKLNAGEVKELYSTDGRRVMTRETLGTYQWEDAIKSKIRETTRAIKALGDDIKLLGQLISDWKEQPLPGEGAKIKPPPAFLR